jgi:hypothetical protein
MIMAWNDRETRDEVCAMVAHMTRKQRGYLWQELWQSSDYEWRAWAGTWLVNEQRKREAAARKIVERAKCGRLEMPE